MTLKVFLFSCYQNLYLFIEESNLNFRISNITMTPFIRIPKYSAWND